MDPTPHHSGAKTGRTALTIVDRDLPSFGFTVAKDGAKTFFGRAQRPFGPPKTLLGTADGMTAVEVRAKAVAAIASAKNQRETGPLFTDFAEECMRCQDRGGGAFIL
ncbi:MAG: hypothetical protein F4133_12695 [Gammaproteobacteria bacterium]|nr:hypothetical protein [Gammaproteobacteria bacterium]